MHALLARMYCRQTTAVASVSQSQVLVMSTWRGILTAWLYPNALQAAALVHILINPDSVLTNLEYAVL